jgi:hypothetical protein
MPFFLVAVGSVCIFGGLRMKSTSKYILTVVVKETVVTELCILLKKKDSKNTNKEVYMINESAWQ